MSLSDILETLSKSNKSPENGTNLLYKMTTEYYDRSDFSLKLQNQVTDCLNRHNRRNNSFQWKTNLQNSPNLDLLQPVNSEQIEKDFNSIKSLYKAKTEAKTITQMKPQTNYNNETKNSNFSLQKPYIRKPIYGNEGNALKNMETDSVSDECQGSYVQKDMFRTARDELQLQAAKKKLGGSVQRTQSCSNLQLNGPKSNKRKKFVSPLLSNINRGANSSDNLDSAEKSGDPIDERLKNIDPKMVELVSNEIMDTGTVVEWSDIAGLEFAKTAIQESVVWPMLRPDIFTGLRRPPKGILLFGPPGTGKTLIGKCIASQSKATFFSISASSLTSKWVGEGEKMVRALFAVARCHQPAVIFIDEIDSLLSQRNGTEHESSRRIKTEFLVQLDGATTENEERLLLIGATNRPQELDEAARRRFVKRLYIPLPEFNARYQLVSRLLAQEKNSLGEDDFKTIAQKSDGYSGADIRNLCSDACLGPIRTINITQIETMNADDVPPVDMKDFEKALTRVRSSVSPNDLDQYIKWDKTYGSGSF